MTMKDTETRYRERRSVVTTSDTLKCDRRCVNERAGHAIQPFSLRNDIPATILIALTQSRHAESESVGTLFASLKRVRHPNGFSIRMETIQTAVSFSSFLREKRAFGGTNHHDTLTMW